MPTVAFAPYAVPQFLDNFGKPIAGGTLETYLAGTSTPAATYADNAGTVPNPTTIQLDSSGRPSNNGALVDLRLDVAKSYKFVLKDKAGETVRTVDNILGGLPAGSVGGAALADGAVTTPVLADGAVTATKLPADDDELSKITQKLVYDLHSTSGYRTVISKLWTIIDVTDFGAVGDWDGTSGTDNLPALEAAVAALPPSGGIIRFPVDPGGKNDYLVGDSWNITRSHVTLTIPRGVTLRTTSATTDGHTLAFFAPPNQQIEDVKISGGGLVSATGSSGLDNAIGFARCQNYRCYGMRVIADRKGITAQVDCGGGVVRDNTIVYAGNYGIAIEGDATGTYPTLDVIVSGNRVVESGSHGIYFSYAAGPNLTDVRCSDNIVEDAGGHGFVFSGTARFFDIANIVKKAALRGFSFNLASSFRTIGSRSEQSGVQGFAFINPGDDVTIIAPTVRNASSTTAGASDAFYVESPTADLRIIAPTVRGSGHRYSIGTASMGSSVVRIIDSSGLNSGVSGKYLSAAAVDLLDSADGGRRQQSIPYAASITPDYLNGSAVLVGQLTGPITINAPINARAGRSMTIRLVQNGAGGHSVSWGSGIRFSGTLTTTGNTVSLVQMEYDGSVWRGWILYTGQAI